MFIAGFLYLNAVMERYRRDLLLAKDALGLGHFLAWNWTEGIVQILADLCMGFRLLSDIILIKVSLQVFFVILCTKQ